MKLVIVEQESSTVEKCVLSLATNGDRLCDMCEDLVLPKLMIKARIFSQITSRYHYRRQILFACQP